MSRTFSSLLIVTLACTLFAGCSESDQQQATGKGAMIAVNAIVDAPDVVFRIEERSLGTAAFGTSTQLNRYDDLSYTFNFDIQIADTTNYQRLASRPLDVVRDTFYLFALGGTIAAPQDYLWEDELRIWSGTETVFELSFTNLNTELGPVDIYFAAPGVDPVVGNEIGRLALGERIPPAEFAAGEYVLILTAAGDPQTVHYTSGTRTWSAASSDYIVAFDQDPSRNETVTVLRTTQSGSSSIVADPRFPATARVLHAASDVSNIDIAENDDFANLIVTDLAFGALSGEVSLATGLNDYTVTDAGNQGAILVEEEITIAAATNQTLVFVGPASDPDILASPSVRRPYSTSGRAGIVHSAQSFDFVDIYLLEAGESIDDNSARYSFVPFKTQIGSLPLPAKNYELTVTLSGEKTIVAGPQSLDVANADVFKIFVLDTADPNVAEIRIVTY